MVLSELRDECRERTDDLNAPYLWSDAQWAKWLNQAVDEAAVRAFLIYDETTPSACQYTVTPPTRIFTLDPTIVRVESAWLSSAERDLCRDDDITQKDVSRSTWRSVTGTPDSFGVIGTQLFLNRVPTAADTLNVRVHRRPLSTEIMVAEFDEPVIPAEYHLDLIHWALYKAFIKKDADGRSDADAEYHEAKFEARFGKKPSAKTAQVIRSSRHRGRMHGPGLGN